MNLVEPPDNAQPIAPGFEAAGIAAGIKGNGKHDLAIFTSSRPCTAAGVFTTNLVQAAPVTISRRHLVSSDTFQGVIISSGNANAATGRAGLEAAEAMCAALAEGLGCAPEQVLIGQTGLIGKPFPTKVAVRGVGTACEARSPRGGMDAARAMMTTDTVAKVASVSQPGFTVCGVAKGAAMLSPSMATMLAVLTTDIAAPAVELQAALQSAMEGSFHSMVVDGCRSTNDTVLLVANGGSGTTLDASQRASFFEAVRLVCESLARQMAADGEGATKFMKMRVTGAISVADARRAAKAVVSSALVKCSLAGESCYFGRVLSELGASGARFNPDNVTIAYGGITICRGGVAHSYPEDAMAKYLTGKNIEIHADLGAGLEEATAYGCDLTHGYVDENMGKS